MSVFTGSVHGEDGVFTSEKHRYPGMELQMQDVVRVLKSGSKTPAVSGNYRLDIIRAIMCLYETGK